MSSNSDETFESFRALRKLLKAVCADPASYLADLTLLDALRSQGKLAKYVNETLGIKGASLNTIKRKANVENEDGYEGFDRLRTLAANAIESSVKFPKEGKKVTKGDLLNQIQVHKDTIRLLKEDLLLLSYALDKSIRQARTYVERASDPGLVRTCEKDQGTILRILSLRKIPVELRVV